MIEAAALNSGPVSEKSRSGAELGNVGEGFVKRSLDVVPRDRLREHEIQRACLYHWSPRRSRDHRSLDPHEDRLPGLNRRLLFVEQVDVEVFQPNFSYVYAYIDYLGLRHAPTVSR